MKEKKYKKIYLIIIICVTILTLTGGTLAYWQWNINTSQRTNLVLTVEETYMCEADGGGNITEEDIKLAPASCTNKQHAIQRTITVKPSIFGNHSVTMDLWLDVNSIDPGLSNSENLKYAITTIANSCTEGVVKTGTFNGKNAGSRVDLFNYKIYETTTTDTYYLYIWLDKAEFESTTMDQKFNFSLNGECEDAPTSEGQILYDLIDNYAVADNISSKYVSSSTGIDFGEISGNTNGKGVYTIASTMNDTYPVHYYRGPVENNNVIFANHCWKIVRTTETGGTKLIYNGTPTNGQCYNTSTASQLPSRSGFNTTQKLEAAGYMYGTPVHTFTTKLISEITDQTIFSNDVTYDYATQKYTLTGQKYLKDTNLTASNLNEMLKNNHYTCFSTSETGCTSEVYFVYMIRNTSINFVKLTKGETIESLIENTFNNSANTTSSLIKQVVDKWYENYMTSYTHYLEDAVWCNDRSIAYAPGWSRNGDVLDQTPYKLNFGANDRITIKQEPSVECKNLSDRFTVDTKNGNGALTYPTALITLDEAAFAGYVWFVGSSNNYLNTDKVWWTMTPTIASANLLYVSILYSIADNVQTNYTANGAGGVRPMISLKYGITISSGYGTGDKPYIINESL